MVFGNEATKGEFEIGVSKSVFAAGYSTDSSAAIERAWRCSLSVL